MSAWLASIVYVIGILGLSALGRDRASHTSKALWLPTLWLLVASSRMLSTWLAMAGVADVGWSAVSPNQLLEGSPFDRLVLTSGVLLGIVILFRRQDATIVLRRSWPVVLFFLFGALSTLWSDYPSVAMKRWIKALGDLIMVLLVLTEADPTAAMKRVLFRVTVVLIPVSVLLVKYFPDIGRGYDPWTGRLMVLGVTLDKNLLGMVCLIAGLASASGFLLAWKHRTKGPAISHGVLLAMTMWLLREANSMTSTASFILAGIFMVAIGVGMIARRRWLIHGLVMVVASVAWFALFHGQGELLEALGRDSTLTGRTEVWEVVLDLNSNALLGAGFESFWLGPRLEKMWSMYWWHPNQAHNGYIEVVLNLGWVGLGIFMVLMLESYRRMVTAVAEGHEVGALMLAYWLAAAIYNLTESAIRVFNPIWIVSLLMAVESFRLGVPGMARRSSEEVAPIEPRENPADA
jgi:exopolysaccharide production protein ExoQ